MKRLRQCVPALGAALAVLAAITACGHGGTHKPLLDSSICPLGPTSTFGPPIAASAIRLPPGVETAGTTLFGTNFGSPMDAYVLSLPKWGCATLQGGTGMAVTASPDAATGDQKTYIASIANYDGAGGDFILDCDVFRSALASIPDFPADQCGPSDLAARTKVALVPTPKRDPLVAVVTTPPSDPEPVNGQAPNGLNTTYDFVFLGLHANRLQGLTCAVPPTLKYLCIQNLQIFLATSLATRGLSVSSDQNLVADVSRIIGT